MHIEVVVDSTYCSWILCFESKIIATSINLSSKKEILREAHKVGKILNIPIIVVLERSVCNHFWVERTDGYEEQCGAAICNKCGKYGCYCDAQYGRMTEERKQIFHQSGIPGNDHQLEKSKT